MMRPSRRDFLRSGAITIPAVRLGSGVKLNSEGMNREEVQKGKRLPRIRVHKDGHFLETEDGAPFFWLGDTAWKLIHATTREECSYYLHMRARQGFTVIQTVALSEFDNFQKPNVLGLKPFEDAKFSVPNEAYFARVVEIVREAASLGLYVALVPSWGDKLTAPWGAGPRIFRNDNLESARSYARYLGTKLKGESNLLWILGGDRPPCVRGTGNDYPEASARAAGFPVDQDWRPIWREFAAGLKEGWGVETVIGYHPQGGASSSLYLHEEPWLSFNGMQSGHGSGHDVPVWEWIARDYEKLPAKPTLDLEPNYEDHPVNPWPTWDAANGFFRDLDVRKQTYRSVFAGGCGVTYGHNSIWGFVNARNHAPLYPERDWVDAMERPGGRQMIFLRKLMESRPYFRRIPDRTLIRGNAGVWAQHVQATRDAEGKYAFVYFPGTDMEVSLELSSMATKKLKMWWYDPRTGVGELQGVTERENFRSPMHGGGLGSRTGRPVRGI
jgi:Protein of unknown function (DUF4038)/Putative collagen-binding domain of a collagenase